jgi:hypothetical protein
VQGLLVALGDYIPEWDMIFDPHDTVRVDHATKRVNRFTLSPCMRATARHVKARRSCA